MGSRKGTPDLVVEMLTSKQRRADGPTPVGTPMVQWRDDHGPRHLAAPEDLNVFDSLIGRLVEPIKAVAVDRRTETVEAQARLLVAQLELRSAAERAELALNAARLKAMFEAKTMELQLREREMALEERRLRLELEIRRGDAQVEALLIQAQAQRDIVGLKATLLDEAARILSSALGGRL